MTEEIKKDYYQINKEDRLIKAKMYYQRKKANAHLTSEQKELINIKKKEDNLKAYKEYRDTKNTCVCGGRYTNRNVHTHYGSQRHKLFLLSSQKQENILI
jgi:hypothetical protein